MSTDLSDGAMGVAADADGNAYVVGYRNASNFIGDIFVSRIDISGRLAWVTNLEKSVSVNYDYPYLKPVVTNDAVYVVVADQNDDFAFTLHKLAFDGTRLWSKKPFGTRGALGAIAATPDGKLLYISSHPYSNDEIVISALDGTGAIVWEVVAPDARRLEVASDGSLYETPDDIDYYRVSKRAADGTLEWTREFVPSVPFQEGVIENRMELYVAADGIYAVAHFLQRGDVGENIEITRFSAEGEKEWSQPVIPQGQKSPDCRDDWHCLGTLGVTSGGELYVTRGNVLIQLTATGERLETDSLNWYEDATSDKVLTRAKLPSFLNMDLRMFFMKWASQVLMRRACAIHTLVSDLIALTRTLISSSSGLMNSHTKMAP